MYRPVFSRTFLKTSGKQKEYYRLINPALGEDFEAKIFAAVQRAVENPQFYTMTERAGMRRILLERFPYAVFYRVKGRRVNFIRCRADTQRPIY